MSTTATPAFTFDVQEARHTPSPTTPGKVDEPDRPAETQSAWSRLSRFGEVFAPAAVLAALAAPAYAYPRRWSSSGLISTPIFQIHWDHAEPLAISSAWTTQAEIDELNRVFAMSPPEGLRIELPDS